MKLLLISPNLVGQYSSSLLRNVQRALDRLGISWTQITPEDPVEDYRGYDLYLGVGDEILRKRPRLVERIRSTGGVTADFRTRFLPRKPVRLLMYGVGLGPTMTDYAFTHFHTRHPRGFYVGQGVNDDLLYPDHDGVFTVMVDHFMGSRRSSVQHILDQCADLKRSRSNVRVWYHTQNGIEEDRFVEDRAAPITIPFADLAAYYRRVHVFLPTHRETQGMVGAEVGMCGGLVLLAPWMYPLERARQMPHRYYWSRIHWPEAVDFAANRAQAQSNFGIEGFTARLKTAIERTQERR